jgi:ATP/maltotriose-dependent transcriptional regulator MalT
MTTDKLIDNNWSNNQQVLLDRQRVNKLFAGAVKYPLVAVTAGAGYGKTRAVSMFLNKCKNEEKKLWMQFSKCDNMSARFWENFVKSTSELSPPLA